MAKAKIGSLMNSVVVEYGTGADNDVEETLITLLKAVIKSDVANGKILEKIYVSATTNGVHESPRHASGEAIDISRINGKKMEDTYASDADVKAIVDALQDEGDNQSGIRENFELG